jgi:hypothetical protein
MFNKPMDILHDSIVTLRAMAIVIRDDGNYSTASALREIATNIEATFFKENEKEISND